MASNLSGGISQQINNSNFNHQCIWRMDVLYIDKDGKEKVQSVGYPCTINFNISRNTGANANTANFKIYNLAPSTRNGEAFFQDRFNTAFKKIVTFKAGYGGLVTCFRGCLSESYSARQGVDIVTSMQCLDLGTLKNEIVNVTFEAGTKKLDAYKNIIQNSDGLTLGYIGTIEGEFKTPTTFYGDILSVLNQITNNHTYIDKGVVHTTQNNECLDIGVTVLKSSTGLIGTPQRNGAGLVVKSVFNPDLQVGQLLQIDDPIANVFNGTYMITGITHSGEISGAIAGQRITTIELLIGAFLPNSSYNQTGSTTFAGFNKVKGENITPVSGNLQADAISVYNYIQKNNGKYPNTKITQNISWKEMIENDNNDSERKNELTVEIISNCIIVAKKLQAFIDTNTPNAKIKINSGWRSRRVNNSLKNAAKESAHLRGLAIDFKYYNANTYSVYRDVYKKYWDKFTYLFRTQSGSAVIHVQATLGKGQSRRSPKSLI